MKRTVLPLLCAAMALPASGLDNWVWIEGESPSETDVGKHPWYYGETRKDLLSGNDFLAHFGDRGPGRAEYRFDAPAEGEYAMWVRGNPVGAAYTFAINGGEPAAFVFGDRAIGNVNLAPDGKPDLRFIAWANAGTVKLQKGANTLVVTFEGKAEMNHHGSLDCVAFTQGAFHPSGTEKPDAVAAKMAAEAAENAKWASWDPPEDDFRESPIDLRALNEQVAGERGFVSVQDGRFVLGSGEPVRFWAVNGPAHGLRGEELKRAARQMAKRGVNLVRVHGGMFDRATGELDRKNIEHLHEIVAAMKAEGIYVHLSIYFPLWMSPRPGLPFLQGYNGEQHPFAALMFNPEFREVYRGWWRAILAEKPASGGPALIAEPAVMGAEIQNEDSFFFWTFRDENLPEPQRVMLQKMFGDWAKKRYGSIAGALKAWGGMRADGDDEGAGRLGFRHLWAIFTERSARDQDTAEFLLETQRRFYEEEIAHLRKLGFKGLITASNWTTANNDILGPHEKYSYLVGDFVDRHGYWGGLHTGENSAWSIRDGHEFTHRSALRFDPPEPGKPQEIGHPVFDPKYNGLPSMISETTFTRPSRYRTEAPAFYAAYGALQGSDAIVHFAHDGGKWQVKPQFWMQPWTLMSPAMMGQFPAAALLYRQGLLAEGELMADVRLAVKDMLALKGSALVQSANLDELRKADVAGGGEPARGGKVDPIVHLVGKTSVTITENPGETTVKDLAPYHDAAARTVRSSTGEIYLDYGKGVMRLTGSKALGAVGNLGAAGKVDLPGMTVESPLDLACVLLVPLDGRALAESKRMLLQVMTEERPSNFAAEAIGGGKFRIQSIGVDPWLYRKVAGTVTLSGPGAESVRVTALDLNGYPVEDAGRGPRIELRPETVYYFLER